VVSIGETFKETATGKEAAGEEALHRRRLPQIP
jgi:hypothetical protein